MSVTDFQLTLDNLRHGPESSDKGLSNTEMAHLPAFTRGDPCRLYQMYLPVQMSVYLRENVGRGKMARFIRQAITEKIANSNLPGLLSATKAALPILKELTVDNDVGKAEYLALKEALAKFDK